MRRFLNYPVIVNHPGRYWDARLRQLAEIKEKDRRTDTPLERAKDLHMFRWLQHTGKNLYETIEDPNPPPAAVAYEKAVIEALNVIVTTQIGRLVLGAMDRNIRYSIHPRLKDDGKNCECGAFVFPGAPKEGGGIRIYYNPTEFNDASRRWIGRDDVLFHELVHAYRMGRWSYETINNAPDMVNWDDSEEFVATQMQNAYLSQRGGQRFYRSYPKLERADKGTAYKALMDDREALGQLNFFVNTDSVMGTVAGWAQPVTSFNSFRDRTVLGRLGGMP
jgi:hypothetical protein